MVQINNKFQVSTNEPNSSNSPFMISNSYQIMFERIDNGITITFGGSKRAYTGNIEEIKDSVSQDLPGLENFIQ